jgi:hypothetical protein
MTVNIPPCTSQQALHNRDMIAFAVLRSPVRERALDQISALLAQGIAHAKPDFTPEEIAENVTSLMAQIRVRLAECDGGFARSNTTLADFERHGIPESVFQ